MSEESSFVPGPEERPSTYLVLAVLATIFLCFPTGIVAIFYGASVNSAYDMGDLARAQSLSASARQWVFFSIIGAIVGWLFFGSMSYWFWA
jgi:hypothetical protein